MSSTNTDSTDDSNRFSRRRQWATRSRLYTSSGVPTYQTFLEHLWDLDTSTLTPGATCPICRIPFIELDSDFNNRGPEHERLRALESLPFHDETGSVHLGRPVRLPCTAQHIVGRACIMSWASEGGGTTCPLDREKLFTIGPEELMTITHDEDRFKNGVRHISQMSIRHLLQRFRNATESDIVTVNARSMTARLATLIFRVVFQSYGISEVTTSRWKWPRIRRPLYTQEVQNFQHLVKHFIKAEPLMESGQYSAHITTLLNPALPHVFTLLYRLARFFQAQTIPLCDLAYAMREHLHGFFFDFSHTITAKKALKAITFKTIDLWVTQELVMTRLRTATNQGNEWDDTMARGVRPYFAIAGEGGMLGYLRGSHHYGRDRDTLHTPLSLAVAAEWVRFDVVTRTMPSFSRRSMFENRESPSSHGSQHPLSPSSNRQRSSRIGDSGSSSLLWEASLPGSPRIDTSGMTRLETSGSSNDVTNRAISPQSDDTRGFTRISVRPWPLQGNDSRGLGFEGNPSPSLSALVQQPWSPLSDNEPLSQPRASVVIARISHRMRRRRMVHEVGRESDSNGIVEEL